VTSATSMRVILLVSCVIPTLSVGVFFTFCFSTHIYWVLSADVGIVIISLSVGNFCCGVATISRLLTIIGLFCRISSLL